MKSETTQTRLVRFKPAREQPRHRGERGARRGNLERPHLVEHRPRVRAVRRGGKYASTRSANATKPTLI